MQRFVKALAAVLLLTGGAIHLDLWRGGYRGIEYIGPMFLANVVASALIAAAVLVRRDRVILLAGVGLAASSLVGLVLSRTVGLLGFMDSGWTMDAYGTIGAEVGAIVALGLIAVMARNSRGLVPRPVPATAG